MEDYEPKPKCLRTKNNFRFSNPRCLGCGDRKECFVNTQALLKTQGAPFRTIPWELFQHMISSEARYVVGVLWCAGDVKIKPKKKKATKGTRARRDKTLCQLSHAEIIERWGRNVTAENLRQHLVSVEHCGLIKRSSQGRIHIPMQKWISADTGEAVERGRWEEGLNISPIIHRDDELTDTEKIVIAGALGFGKLSAVALARKLHVSRSTVMRIKSKFRMDF
jgi:hypothetical protein